MVLQTMVKNLNFSEHNGAAFERTGRLSEWSSVRCRDIGCRGKGGLAEGEPLAGIICRGLLFNGLWTRDLMDQKTSFPGQLNRIASGVCCLVTGIQMLELYSGSW